MATWTLGEPEVVRNIDKQGLTLLKVAGTAIANGNTYDFGCKVVDAAWVGTAATDRANVGIISDGTVIVYENEAGNVAGTIYAWVEEFA